MTVNASMAAAGGRFARVLFTVEAALGMAALGGAVAFWATPRDAMSLEVLARATSR